MTDNEVLKYSLTGKTVPEILSMPDQELRECIQFDRSAGVLPSIIDFVRLMANNYREDKLIHGKATLLLSIIAKELI